MTPNKLVSRLERPGIAHGRLRVIHQADRRMDLQVVFCKYSLETNPMGFSLHFGESTGNMA